MRIFAALLLACGGSQTSTVTVEMPRTTQPKPVASALAQQAVSPRAFVDAGCKEHDGVLDCAGARIDGIDACRGPLAILQLELNPPAAIATCTTDDTKPGLRATGCMLRGRIRLLAATGSGFHWVTSAAELAALFAPVESPAEAIAFASAKTGSDPYEKPITPPPGATGPNLRTVVTRAERVNGGFRVRLFHSEICGCEHMIQGIDYMVWVDGTVSELHREDLWEEPHMHGMCVD